MKRSYFSKLIALAAAMFSFNAADYAQVTCYNVGGVTSTYTVPAGCTGVKVDMSGAVGGTGNSGSHGGYGGRVVANVSVSPGQQIFVFTGSRGANGSTTSSTKNGGLNGATGTAVGGNGYYQGGGGGGATDIRIGGTQLSNRVLVAGGGGGSGQNYNNTSEWGGAGGGLTGETGYMGYNGGTQDPCICGLGGTQVGAGGGSTCYTSSTSGGPMGYGGSFTSWTGGGGGGYWGGGVGYYGGGGGGSSWYGGAGVSNASTTMGYNNGDGTVCFTPLVPTVTSATAFFDFGTIQVGTYSVPQSTVITGSYLQPSSGTCSITIPSNYEALDPSTGAVLTSPVSVPYSGAGFTYTLIVRFKPTAPIPFNNIITVTGGGLLLPYQIPVMGIGSNTACSGAPTAGSSVVTPSSGGTGTFFLLNLSGLSSATGYTYQWQSSPTGSAPWTNIAGAIGITHVVKGISANTYYRCIVTCPSGSSSNSTPVMATFVGGNATGCSGTPAPGISYASINQGCSPFSTDLWEIGASWDSGIVHKWQQSYDNLSWTDISSSNVTAMRVPISSTIYYRDVVTCIISGSSTLGPTQTITLDAPPSPIVGVNTICSAVPSPMGDATPLGTWSSSNIGVAQVDPSGLVTGVGAGTATISYTLSTGCYSSTNVTVNMSPAPITGTPSVCTGLTTALSTTSTTGTWSSSDVTLATVNTSGLVSGLSVGNVNISYTMPSGCARNVVVAVNQQPAPIGGATSVCEGASLTLSEAISGGTWVSSNSFQASVNPSTGFVTGIVAGTSPTISYTLPGGCTATKPMTINSLPAPISGSNVVCQGSVETLSDAGTGTWSSSNTSIASVVPATGDVTGISGGTVTITYTLAGTGCKATKVMNVNTLPIVFNVTGGGSYCAGGLGSHIGLSGSTAGINYDLYNTSGYLTTVPGSNSGLDFGLWPAGTYTVKGVDASGCTKNMSGSAVVTMNPLPTDYPMMLGAASYCAGSGGVDITISGSDAGVTYQLLYGTINSGSPINGTGSGVLHFGNRTAAGNYTVVATNNSTLCSVLMSGTTTVSVNSNPVIYPVSGSGTSYCAGGTGIEVTMNNSDPAVSYELYKNGIATGNINLGAGTTPISFGFQTLAATYTVKGTDINNCKSTMSGNVPVAINPLPVRQTMTGGGSFCSGGAGVHMGLNYSVSGINYQLMTGGTLVPGTMKPGSNSALDFGSITGGGTYIVIGTNPLTNCADTMNGSKTVNVNMPPNPYTVTGGGPYCIGTGGSTIQLISSDAGDIYRLYRGTTLVTSVSSPFGGPLSFGSYTTAGTYTVTGYDPTTGCSGNMTGSATVSINTLPIAYTLSVTNSGHYCTGGTGDSIILNNSEAGTNYYLYDATGVVGSATPSTGGRINFGPYTNSGSYYATATSPSGCVNNMIGLVNITVDPLPAVYTVTSGGTGNYCAGGAGLHILLSGSNKGINYQLSGPGGPVGTALGGTNAPLDFGVQTAGGAYTVMATNAITHCVSSMNGPGVINVIPLPNIYTLTTDKLLFAGSYCPGGSGVDVQLDLSDNGIDYKFYKNGSYASHMYGNGSSLDFGLSTVGKYTVVATDTAYGCVSNMTGTVNIGNYALPGAYSVTGDGQSYCVTSTGKPVGLSNSATGVQYQLYNTSGAVGGPIFGTSGSAITFGDQLAGTYTVGAVDTATTCTNSMTGSATISSIAPVTPVVTISSVKDTICLGDSMMYTPKPVNGGMAPTYEWYVNGASTGMMGGSYWHKPAKQDTISAIMTNTDVAACITTATATSNDQILVPLAPVSPSVTASTPATTICKSSTPVVFTAAGVNGGTPSYQWKKNGLPVGTNSTSYSTTVDDSDVIFVVMVSNKMCRDKDFVYSTPIKMTVNEVILPEFVISPDPGVDVEKGTKVTFTALVSNVTSGATFTYQWVKNGNNITGATSGVYTTSDYNNNDAIGCRVTSKNACGTLPDYHEVFMNVGTTGLVNVSSVIGNVSVVPNPNKGMFSVKGSLNSTTDQEVSIDITNMLGQTVYTSKVIAKNGIVDEHITLGNTLANGMYLLNLRSGSESKVFHFVLEQ